MSLVACCLLHVASRLSHVACRLLHDACCVSALGCAPPTTLRRMRSSPYADVPRCCGVPRTCNPTGLAASTSSAVAGGTVGVCRRRRPTDRPTAAAAVVPLTAVGVRRSVFGGGAASGNGRLHPRANGSRSRLLGELWERVAAAVRSQQQRRCTGRCDSPAAAGQGVQLIDQQGIGATKLPTAALRALWLAGLASYLYPAAVSAMAKPPSTVGRSSLRTSIGMLPRGRSVLRSSRIRSCLGALPLGH